MQRKDAEKIATEYLKPILGFALKRCKTPEDAEDLSQEIILKVYKTLLCRDDIRDVGKFIWTLAHNSLATYYRENSRISIGIPIDGLEEIIAEQFFIDEDNYETICRLKSEIAYLSKIRRQILIAYYFEQKRQSDISKELAIPVGTVKWHLFEAKKDLKRGMEKMRETSNLKFNPVSYERIWFSGILGNPKSMDMLKSKLVQNICYCIRNTAKTVGEISDDIGVSPVFIEEEVEKLEKYQYITEENGKYLLNFIIQETTQKLCDAESKTYDEAADLIANSLYDELTSCGILDNDDIYCVFDRNYLLWTFIPYVASMCGEADHNEKIKHEDAWTIRPDGSKNIVFASVNTTGAARKTKSYVSGPMHGITRTGEEVWKIDSGWDLRKSPGYLTPDYWDTVLPLCKRDMTEKLSPSEYAYLAENGFVSMNGDGTARWLPVIISGNKIKDKLFEIGKKVYKQHSEELKELAKPFIEESLNAVPAQVKNQMEFLTKFIFKSDGVFVSKCLETLLNNGKLKEPTEEEGKSLSTLFIMN